MIVLDAVGRSLAEAFAMFWATLWALVLGFGLSGAVQAFVSRARMQAALGDHRPVAVAKASFFGAVSSSCSYAASALAKSVFARGADFTAAMVFMLASTNLVVELGVVLWLLIGWQFALAEFVGGAIMILLLVAVLPRVVPAAWLGRARAGLESADVVAGADEAGVGDAAGGAGSAARARTRAGWADAAGYTISDLTMLRREIVAGFLIAGFLAELVPSGAWNSLFLTGHGAWSSIENVLLGPFLALISFVCSVGNVPLAAALWHGGISFGGVVSFVFADLITIPLLLIYRRYYGARITLRLLGVFWAVMSAGGLATEYLFKAVDLVPSTHPATVAATGVELNYTTILNIIALAAFGYLYWLYRDRGQLDAGTGYATDVVCGMQVERVHAPATARHGGRTYYFCSDRCHARFLTDPDRYTAAAAEPGKTR
ncbi:MAG TPA: permease [Jatrophihabitantaceae bacterium]|nr:permease [Jatrophihabitantaceae bacterium]